MRSASIDALDVLIVDDDDSLLRTLSDILRIKGYNARIASSGRAGVELAGGLSDPALIALVDLKLPDMDGLEVVRSLREVAQQTEVVILTGNASVDTAVGALREQSVDYLIKPVQPEILLKTLERARERRMRHDTEQALMESEDQLRRIFDSVADGIVITESDGTIIRSNRGGFAILAHDPAEIVGHSLRSFLRIDESVERMVAPGPTGDEVTREMTLLRPGGVERLIEVRTSAFPPGQYIHLLRDLTERRELEERVRQSQKLEAVGQLAGGVAHDFNNILTAIQGNASLLLADDIDDETREGVTEIQNAAQRAARLTRQLLAFSRKQLIQPSAFDLVEVVEQMEGMLRRLVREDIDLVTDYPARGAFVKADPTQVEQIVMNLVVNARDAMPEGGAVRIEVRRVELGPGEGADLIGASLEPGQYLELLVADSGHGMDRATISHIFEPFFTTKEVGKGTGLGLASVLGAVETLSGALYVDSVQGTGTTFHVYLPCADEQAPAANAAHEPTAVHSGSERILVVEDDEPIRALTARVLSRSGYRVSQSRNGAEALERLGEEDFDLVVTDVIMPGINGHALATQVAELKPGVRFLFTSGYSKDVISHRGILDAGIHYLEKPFTPAALRTKVRQTLDALPERT